MKKQEKQKIVVVSLGGSIMYPEYIDIEFLKRFKQFIVGEVKRGGRFIIVVGGGRISRVYQEAAGKIARVTDDDRDWLGIHATRSNAHLLRTIFRELSDPVVIDARHRLTKLKYPVTIASGWRPGWSTDYIAIQLAADFGAKEAIIAGKPSHVYDKDFVKYPDAKPYETLTWNIYRTLIPKKWKPGFHSPVDPVAARTAMKEKIRAIVINGRDLKNFARLLRGKKFVGTVIA